MSSGWFRTIVQHREPGLQWSFTGVRGGSILPNLLEPLSSRGIKDHRIISHEFGVDQLFQTCSNQSTTQGTSPAVEFDMSSCRFNATLPNLLDPLSSRGNKDHKVFSYEFGVVQLFRTSSNHSTTQGTRPSVEFDTSSRNDPCWTVSSDFRWFASAEPTRTTAASMQGIIPPAQFPLSSGCIWFDSSESTRTTSATKKSSLPDHFPMVRLRRTHSNHCHNRGMIPPGRLLLSSRWFSPAVCT